MKIAICDDSKQDAQRIHQSILHQNTVENSFENIEITTYLDGSELICDLQNNKKFDVIFLDIKMKRIDGFKTAKYIRSYNQSVMIFFTTSLAAFMPKAFLFEASGYLIKPIQYKDVQNALLQVLKKRKSNDNIIVLETKNQIRNIELQKIISITVQNNRQLNYNIVNEKNIIVYESLKSIEKELEDKNFIKVSRSALINLYFLRGFDSLTKEAILINNIRIPVAQNKWMYARQQFIDFLQPQF